jgi:hypothetical protein
VSLAHPCYVANCAAPGIIRSSGGVYCDDHWAQRDAHRSVVIADAELNARLQEFSNRVIKPAMEAFATLPHDEQQRLLRECGLTLEWVLTPKAQP